MSKHVYPPWYKSAQRTLFVVAAVLIITFPTLYGRRRISVTALVVVLGVFFGFWLAFSLGVRYLLPSYTPESTLPIHIHAPLPPVVLHSPKPDAVPAAPAIRIHSAYDHDNSNPQPPSSRGRARFDGDSHGDQHDQDTKVGWATDDNQSQQHSDSISTHHCTQLQREGAVDRAGIGQGIGVERPSANSNGNNVKFQTRARGYTADSTNSEVYPTFATYRQAQHTSFDAFTQRIRRAFVAATEAAANATNESNNNNNNGNTNIHQRQGDDGVQSGTPLQQPDGSATASGEEGSSNKEKSGGGGLLTVEKSHGSIRSSSSSPRGRPRSTSAASMISNLSEKIKLGNFFGRSSTSSRRGSDASSLVQPSGAMGVGIVTPTIITTDADHEPPSTSEEDVAALDVPSSQRRSSVSLQVDHDVDMAAKTSTSAGAAGATELSRASWDKTASSPPSPSTSTSPPSSPLTPVARRLSLSKTPREPSPLAIAGNVMTHPRIDSTASTEPDADDTITQQTPSSSSVTADLPDKADSSHRLEEPEQEPHRQQLTQRAPTSPTADDRPVDLSGLKTSGDR
ncbi:hypothetical protein BGW41_005348 [Actinomortierella wolfii]|nr:hypothetical protein BGW41_005348 [Actinomortierella wolfii]